MKLNKSCPVCGNDSFTYNEVLWPELIDEWELDPYEVGYINRQQGLTCSECGNNLRSMALANAILKKYPFSDTLKNFVRDNRSQSLKILEINEAGGLTPTLAQLPNHLLIQHPEYDMQNLALNSGEFDLVLHSDTLEHVKDPIKGLAECKRVLHSKGSCIYTVPIIVGRLTRLRKGLKASHHGTSTDTNYDLLVHTEFGADMWSFPLKSGFQNIQIHSLEYPAAIAIEASTK